MRLAPSPIHGVGVFALRAIAKGEKLHCFPNQFRKWYAVPYERFNEIREEVRSLILERWASVINGSSFQSPNDDAWMILFMNHDDNPSYDIKTDCALRDIKRGEEIVEDYRTMKNAKQVFNFL